MRPIALIALLCIPFSTQTAVAETHSLFSYSAGRFPVFVDGRKYIVDVRKNYDTILIQAAMENVGGVAKLPIQTWRQVAETFVEPAGCGISSIEAITVSGGTWEATYVCPDGIDLHKLVSEQRAALKRGEPLRRNSENPA